MKAYRFTCAGFLVGVVLSLMYPVYAFYDARIPGVACTRVGGSTLSPHYVSTAQASTCPIPTTSDVPLSTIDYVYVDVQDTSTTQQHLVSVCYRDPEQSGAASQSCTDPIGSGRPETGARTVVVPTTNFLQSAPTYNRMTAFVRITHDPGVSWASPGSVTGYEYYAW